MERLTTKAQANCGFVRRIKTPRYSIMQDAIDRLAAYEDTMSIERAQELAQAEKDGRLVVMPPNAPLTLEELREMDGEPVWVEVSENWSKSGSKSGWYLVRFHKSDDRLRIYIYNTRSGATFVPEQDYVQSWLAYRRKPEEGSEVDT